MLVNTLPFELKVYLCKCRILCACDFSSPSFLVCSRVIRIYNLVISPCDGNLPSSFGRIGISFTPLRLCLLFGLIHYTSNTISYNLVRIFNYITIILISQSFSPSFIVSSTLIFLISFLSIFSGFLSTIIKSAFLPSRILPFLFSSKY